MQGRLEPTAARACPCPARGACWRGGALAARGRRAYTGADSNFLAFILSPLNSFSLRGSQVQYCAVVAPAKFD